MNDETAKEFAEGLFFEDMLPLEWRRLDAEPDEAYLAHLNDSNDNMLRMLAIMEERVQDKADEGQSLNAEIARLEAKVNLLLDMAGQILANHLLLPDQTPARLGARGIEFATTDPPTRNERVLISVYLYERYPRPLEVVGSVFSVDDTGNGAFWVRVKFEKMSPAVQDWLEKFIFRRHRRLVAQSRGQAPESHHH